MAEINFLPVCSNCNKVISGNIDCEEYERMDLSLAISMFYEITPRACPNCGEYFDRITMPQRLPFWSVSKDE